MTVDVTADSHPKHSCRPSEYEKRDATSPSPITLPPNRPPNEKNRQIQKYAVKLRENLSPNFLLELLEICFQLFPPLDPVTSPQ
jgi:hypothetical protein